MGCSLEVQRPLDAPGRKGDLSARSQREQENVLLGTAVAVGRAISGVAGPSHAEKVEEARVFVENVEDDDDDEPPPLQLRIDYDSDEEDDDDVPLPEMPQGIAPPLLDGGEGENDG